MEYGIRTIEYWDWVTVIIVGIFAILALTRFLYPKRFHEFLLLPITDRYFKLQGKGYEIRHPFNVLMFAVQVLSISLFFYLLLDTVNPRLTEENKWVFIQLLTAFSVFVLIKYISEKIIATIFNIEPIINSYLYEKLSYASLLSLLILIANILFYYAFDAPKIVIYIFTSVIAVLYLISLLSSFKRNWQLILRHFSYFILYLCALEIAPYVIIYHLVS